MVFRTGSPQPGRQSNGTCFGKDVGRGCAKCTHVHILGRATCKLFAKTGLPVDARCHVRAELPACCRLAVRSGRRQPRFGAAGRRCERTGRARRADQVLPGATQPRGALPRSLQICGQPIQHKADELNKGGNPAFRQHHDKDVPWCGVRMHATELAQTRVRSRFVRKCTLRVR